MCAVDRLFVVEPVNGIPFDEWCNLPLVFFPSESELVSVVSDSPSIFECPTRLDFDIEVDRTVEVWSVFKDESVSPMVFFLVEGPILNSVFDREILVGKQLVSELDSVLSGIAETSISIHDLDWTNFGTNLCMPCSLSVSICVFPVILLDLVVVFGWFCHNKHWK
jgi:hypothetical protein